MVFFKLKTLLLVQKKFKSFRSVFIAVLADFGNLAALILGGLSTKVKNKRCSSLDAVSTTLQTHCCKYKITGINKDVGIPTKLYSLILKLSQV